MKVQIDKSFALPVAAEDAWRHLGNLEELAGCMPGAQITERLGERNYRGTVAVRFGPAAMSFRGDVELRDIDPAARSLRLLGRGTDSSGTSGASMDLTARIEPVDAGNSRLVGKSEVNMSGRAAAFGGRMIGAVADQVLQQFADNFARLAAAPAAGPPGASGSGPAQSAPPGGADAPPARALNGLALIWSVLRAWLRALVGKSAA